MVGVWLAKIVCNSLLRHKSECTKQPSTRFESPWKLTSLQSTDIYRHGIQNGWLRKTTTNPTFEKILGVHLHVLFGAPRPFRERHCDKRSKRNKNTFGHKNRPAHPPPKTLPQCSNTNRCAASNTWSHQDQANNQKQNARDERWNRTGFEMRAKLKKPTSDWHVSKWGGGGRSSGGRSVVDGDVAEEVAHALTVVYSSYRFGQDEGDVDSLYFVALKLL